MRTLQAFFTHLRTFVVMHKTGGAHMGTLYESIISLCNDKGIKGGKMCVDLGISKSTMTDLKSGRRTGISMDTAQKIADYFGVSVDRVLGSEQKEKPLTASGEELDAETIQLKEIWDSADQEERDALLAMAKMLKARRNK
jgi:transcriptional regulator with XRE-family HTH domain